MSNQDFRERVYKMLERIVQEEMKLNTIGENITIHPGNVANDGLGGRRQPPIALQGGKKKAKKGGNQDVYGNDQFGKNLGNGLVGGKLVVDGGNIEDEQYNIMMGNELNRAPPEKGNTLRQNYSCPEPLSNKQLTNMYKQEVKNNAEYDATHGRGMKKPKRKRAHVKNSNWIEHVKEVAAKHGITYGEALSIASKTYKK